MILGPHNTENEFTSEEKIKGGKSSNINQQCEKVEKRFSIKTKQKESECSELCSFVAEKVSNTKMYPCLPETERVRVTKGAGIILFIYLTFLSTESI